MPDASQLFMARLSRWHPGEIMFWLATLLPFWVFPTYLTLASQIAIAAAFALSLDLILGYAGIVSLGHAAYFGVGAYTAGLLAKSGWVEPISGLIVAGLVAGVVGLLTGLIIVRVQRLARLMITIGLGLLAAEVANSAGGITGGANGLQGMPVQSLFGQFEFDFYGVNSYGYALGVLFILFVVARHIVNAPLGLSLRGIRENVARMAPIGAPVRRRLQTVYVIAAAMAGIAGAVLAQTTQTVSLETLNFQRSADVVVMLIIGGTGRLYGGLVGAVIFLVAHDQLADLNPQYWSFWIGLLLIAIVLFLPGGILGGLARAMRLRKVRA